MNRDLQTLTYKQWRKLGGCGLSAIGEAMVFRALGREWENRTLGEIAVADFASGRSMVRFDGERKMTQRKVI